jgi:hypothetical protein
MDANEAYIEESAIEATIDELLDIMKDVSSSFAILRELTDANNRDQYEAIKNSFPDFFISVDRNNIATIVNGIYMLTENRDNTKNLRVVLKKQRSLKKLYEDRIDAWLNEVHSWKPTLKKVAILRSNIFAHRGGHLTASQFAQKAGITYDELGELVGKMEKLLKTFSEMVLFNTVVLPFPGRAKEDTKELMKKLASAS